MGQNRSVIFENPSVFNTNSKFARRKADSDAHLGVSENAAVPVLYIFHDVRGHLVILYSSFDVWRMSASSPGVCLAGWQHRRLGSFWGWERW